MQSLNKSCSACHKPMNGGVYRSAHVCPHCGHAHGEKQNAKAQKAVAQQKSAVPPEQAQQKAAAPVSTPSTAPKSAPKAAPQPMEPANVKLSSDPADPQAVSALLGDIAVDGVVTIQLTPEMFEGDKFLGSKNADVQAALNDAKQSALTKLRQQAAGLGANTVADVGLKSSMKQQDSDKLSLTVHASGVAMVLNENALTESA